MPTATNGQLEEFCRADNWSPEPPAHHQFYTKVIECPGLDPELLRTKVSHDRSLTLSYDRFREILRLEVKVTESEFWQCVRSRRPANRECPPGPPLSPAATLGVGLARQLRHHLGLSERELVGLTREEAIELLNEKRGRTPQH